MITAIKKKRFNSLFTKGIDKQGLKTRDFSKIRGAFFSSHPSSTHHFSKSLSCREADDMKYWVYSKLGEFRLIVCCSDVSQKCGDPLFAPNTNPQWVALSGSVECVCPRVLGKQFWLQVEPLHDVLRHTQDWIHRLDLFISKQREACYSKESVKRVHLQGKREQED